jgi:hypothetical protein
VATTFKGQGRTPALARGPTRGGAGAWPALRQGAARSGSARCGPEEGDDPRVPPVGDTWRREAARAATGRWWAAGNWAARELARLGG